ncbi:MAG: hypothetical protein V4850_12005 [Myxococcota bacterium]
MSTFQTLGLPGPLGVGHETRWYTFNVSRVEGRYTLWIPNEREDRVCWIPIHWEQQHWILATFRDRLDAGGYELSWSFKDAEGARAFVDTLRPRMEGPLPEWIGEALYPSLPTAPQPPLAHTLVTQGLPSQSAPDAHAATRYTFGVVTSRDEAGRLTWVIVPSCWPPGQAPPEQAAWLAHELGAAPGARWVGGELWLESAVAREWFLERVGPALVGERIGQLRERMV